MTNTDIHPFTHWDVVMRRETEPGRFRYRTVRMAFVTEAHKNIVRIRATQAYPDYTITDIQPSPVQEGEGKVHDWPELPDAMADSHHTDPEDPDTPESIAQAIYGGMVQWEAGSLSSRDQDRVLTDILADVWQDCYRQGNREAQTKMFLERVRLCARNALGQEGVL